MIIIGLVIAAVLIIPAAASTGNNAESGYHYTLNIIAKTNLKDTAYVVPDEIKNGGHVIFCPLNKGYETTCRIYLAEGDDFIVLDPNGTDGVARFMLPQPYADGARNPDPATSAYTIYVRVLGKPGGTGKMVTGLCETVEGGSVLAGDECVEDPLGTWLSADEVSLASHSPNDKGNPNQKFVDVTHELTTVDLSNYWICGDGTEQCDYHVGLFDENPFDLDDPATYLYFWDLFNTDMKIIQLRFYPN
jgi:hypothetical protein